MKQKMLVMCDSDLEYCRQFIQYLRSKEVVDWTLVIYSSYEKLENSMDGDQIELLLINEEFYEHEMSEHYKKCMILTEKRRENGIYKYQSVESIITYIQNYYELENSCKEVNSEIQKRVVTSIGVLPFGMGDEYLKLTCSLARVLSRYSKVLMVNLQYVAPSYVKTGEKSISEVIYAYHNKVSNAEEILDQNITSFCGVDYLPPMKHYQDLYDVGEPWFSQMIEYMSTHSKYEIIIFVTDDLRNIGMELLNQCKKIMVPSPHNEYEQSVLSNYSAMLSEEYGDKIRDKIRMITIPDEMMMKHITETSESLEKLPESLVEQILREGSA